MVSLSIYKAHNNGVSFLCNDSTFNMWSVSHISPIMPVCMLFLLLSYYIFHDLYANIITIDPFLSYHSYMYQQLSSHNSWSVYNIADSCSWHEITVDMRLQSLSVYAWLCETPWQFSGMDVATYACMWQLGKTVIGYVVVTVDHETFEYIAVDMYSHDSWVGLGIESCIDSGVVHW